MKRPIHDDFLHYLKLKDQGLIELFGDLRSMIFELAPNCNELLYHTHALTTVFSHSEKLSDAFCHVPIYTSHLNLGFNKGTLISDSDKLLKGTGKLIRHIPGDDMTTFNNKEVRKLITNAINFAKDDMDKPSTTKRTSISKIKTISS